MAIAKGEITIIEVHDGADGTPSYTHIRYSANSNGNPMTETPQSTTNYIGLYVSSSATAPSTYASYSWTKIKGETGATGASRYTHIAYSANSNGNPMTTSPQSTTKYIGFAVTTSSTAPTGYSSYTWVLIKGDKGDTGKSLTDVISHWFATSLSSGVTHSAAWSLTPVNYSETEPYLWRYEKFIWDDNPNEFTRSDPYIIGQYSKDGADGDGVTQIIEHYQVNNNRTTAPSTWVSPPTAIPEMTDDNPFLWMYETIKWKLGPDTTTAKRIIGVFGQTPFDVAEANGYEGGKEEFYQALALLVEWGQSIDDIPERFENVEGSINDIINDRTISPSEKVQLISIRREIEKESGYLQQQLEDDAYPYAYALSLASEALLNYLDDILSTTDYTTIDVEEFESLYGLYTTAFINANKQLKLLQAAGLEEHLSVFRDDIASFQTFMGTYTDRLDITSSYIQMSIGGVPVMKLTKDRLSFYVDGTEVSYFAGSQLMIKNAMVIQAMKIGNHIIEKFDGNNFTVFKWVGS